MANPTTIVQSALLSFGQDDNFYLPYPAATADTFLTNEMIGLNPATGYAVHFDDTIAGLMFWGVFNGPTLRMSTDQPTPILIKCRRPRMFTMPLASGTAARTADIGKLAYVADSGHVQLTPGTLTNANVVGRVFDIASTNPEDLSGAKNVWIEPAYGSLGNGLFSAGFGTAKFRAEGLVYSNVTAAGNGADQTEDTMHTFTLPANTLILPGQTLRIRGWGTTAANADAKTLKVYFGTAAQTLASAVAANAKPWYYEMLVTQVSHASQIIVVNGQFNQTIINTISATATQDETTALTVKSTATAGASNANDISESAFQIEMLN